MIRLLPNLSSRLKFAVFLVLIAILAWKSLSLPIWQDEAYTIYTAQLSPGDAWSRAFTMEEQAPLYFFLMSLWAKISLTTVWLRIPSLLFASASLYLVMYCRPFAQPRQPFIWPVLSLVAFVHLLWAGCEIRLYSMSLFFVLLAIRELDAYDHINRRDLLKLIVISTLSLYTSFLSAIPLAAVFAYYALQRRQWKVLIAFVIASILFLPVLIRLAGVLAAGRSIRLTTIPASITHSLQLTASLVADTRSIVLLRILKWLSLGMIGILLIRENPTILCIAGVSILIFAALVYLSGSLDAVSYRHYMVLLPVILIVLADVGTRWKHAPWLLVFFGLMGIINSGRLVMRDSKAGRWDEVAALAEEYEVEKIGIYLAEYIYVMEYYYDGPAEMFTIPQDLDRSVFDVPVLAIQDRDQLDDRITSWVVPGERFLLIASRAWSYRGTDYQETILREYVNRELVVHEGTTIDGTTIQLVSYQEDTP